MVKAREINENDAAYSENAANAESTPETSPLLQRTHRRGGVVIGGFTQASVNPEINVRLTPAENNEITRVHGPAGTYFDSEGDQYHAQRTLPDVVASLTSLRARNAALIPQSIPSSPNSDLINLSLMTGTGISTPIGNSFSSSNSEPPLNGRPPTRRRH